MGVDQYGEYTPSAAVAYTASFSQVLTMPQMRALPVLALRLLRRLRGIFSVTTIISSWLTKFASKTEPATEPGSQREHDERFWTLSPFAA